MQHGIVRVLPLQFGQQYLHVLQLAGFLPVLDQQHPCPAIGRLAAEHGFQLLLRGVELFQFMQGDRQCIAVVGVVRVQLDGAGQGQQGVFALLVAVQPEPQFVLQKGRVGAQRQGFAQHLAGGVVVALALEQAYLSRQGIEVAGGNRERTLQGRSGVRVVVFVQVQARQVHLGVGIFRLLLQGLLVLLQG
ncbi:hypothetical protein D3C75_764400 [compost metagenome]